MAPVTVIAGVGPGNGAAYAHRFAREGHAVALLARSEDYITKLATAVRSAGGTALGLPVDLASQRAVGEAFARIRQELGPPDVLLQNAAGGPRGPFLELEPAAIEAGFAISVMGMVYCCREVLPHMVQQGSGAVILSGATAALRGSANFGGFAINKFGQRALAQSLAREFGPQGIHVAHVNIDGVIATPRNLERLADKPREFFLDPEDIADAVWHLARQPRSAWSQEIDLRPFGEKF